jgi:hypothetical protein
MVERKAWGTAMAHYERAVAADPTEPRWLKLADTAEAARAYVRAVEALERVGQARGGRDPELDRRIMALRAKAAAGLITP